MKYVNIIIDSIVLIISLTWYRIFITEVLNLHMIVIQNIIYEGVSNTNSNCKNFNMVFIQNIFNTIFPRGLITCMNEV